MKTLTDPAADQVDFAHPLSTTVEKLRHLNIKGKQSDGTPPKNLTRDTPRTAPVETTVYKVEALLMSMRREDDKDMHLVIADPRIGGSMTSRSRMPRVRPMRILARQAQMEKASDALNSACGGLPSLKSRKVVTLRGKVTLTGVGFFDVIHGQGGVATNGIELHPILSFSASTVAGSQTHEPSWARF